ncbi:MAG: hypothetical protein ACLVJH_10905 [Faecalibacterium prausnitzii]
MHPACPLYTIPVPPHAAGAALRKEQPPWIFALFGRYFLDFALLYPSAFLCLASLWEKLRTPRRTACIAAGCITLLCIGCAALCAVFGLNSNSLLPAIVLVSFWLLRWRVTPEVTVSQTAFLFSISAVMMAVCSLLSTLLNAQTEISTHRPSALPPRRCCGWKRCRDAHRAVLVHRRAVEPVAAAGVQR